MAGDDWTELEVEACVADYLHMLTLELSGQTFNKSEHRRGLSKKLSARSDASIELKHRNISAVLRDIGCPWISGYKPLPHYQQLLVSITAEQVRSNALLDQVALSAVEQPAVAPLLEDARPIMVAPPVVSSAGEGPRPEYLPSFVPVKRDYFARESANRSLGLAGELLVAENEARRLHETGRKKLGDKVEHVSKTRGDGLGYDVLSFNEDGSEKYIEVKTTAFGKEAPFFVSRNELAFSRHQEPQFHLYRLFDFRREPKFFMLSGIIEDNCLLDPVSYMARFK